MADWKLPTVTALFDTLHAMCNLLILPPENLRSVYSSHLPTYPCFSFYYFYVNHLFLHFFNFFSFFNFSSLYIFSAIFNFSIFFIFKLFSFFFQTFFLHLLSFQTLFNFPFFPYSLFHSSYAYCRYLLYGFPLFLLLFSQQSGMS